MQRARTHSRRHTRLASASGAVLLTTAAVVGLLPRPASATTLTFAPPMTHQVPGTVESMAVDDLDGDGRRDLVVASGQYVTVLYAVATEDTFLGAPLSYDLGSAVSAVAVGDLNGDAKLDVAATVPSGNIVVVLLNDDAGGFAAPVGYATGTDPLAVAVGDFDNDGAADLAVANRESNTVSLLVNDGSTFQPSIDYQVGLRPAALAAGDINGDGHLDLAVANSGSADVSFLLNDVAGLQAHNVFVGGEPVDVAVGDLDAQGGLDVVVVSATGAVSVLAEAAQGTFQVASSLSAAAIGDLDGDGRADLAVADEAAEQVLVLAGAGDGTFGVPVAFNAGPAPHAIVIAHLDADSRRDVAIGDGNLRKVALLLNTTGDTTPPTTSPLVSLSPTTLSFGEQAVNTTSGSQVVTLANTGDGDLHVEFGIHGTNPADFVIQATTCGLTLPPAESCTISVAFSPQVAGSRSAILDVTSNAPFGPHRVQLSGTGLASPAPAVQVGPTALAFGDQGVGTTSGPKAVTVSNTGNAPLTVSSVTTTGSNSGDFAVSGNTCVGATVAAGGTCTISVTFRPGGAGARTATLVIADDAAGSPRAVALSGTGVVHADVAVSLGATPNPVRTTTNLTYTVTVTNHGPTAAADVVVTDTLPSGSKLVSYTAPNDAACTAPAPGATGTLTCNLGALPVGSTTIQIVVKVVAAGGTTVTNTANVATTANDPNPANNSATVQTAVFGRK